MGEEQIEKVAEMTLKHFGIKEPQETVTIAKNTERIAQDRFLMLARGRGMENRITIDYDTGFPYVLVRFNAL